ncbi:MAG: penicillin-binding transpeptidase domain-containing protein [Lachnospiraceae bacterium]|nr:penicillin-binding transpeptidase domain-containing protein [Lachnospiraceae bacterium]
MNLLTQLSKIFFIILILIFSLEDFTYFKKRTEERRKKGLGRQRSVIIFTLIFGYAILLVNNFSIGVAIIGAAALVYVMLTMMLWRLIYPRASQLLVNNMLMLLVIGFIMICRLKPDEAWKQIVIAAAATVFAFIIPVIIRKLRILSKLTWLYAVLGIVALMAVLALAAISGGAKLSLTIGGISFQFSEIVKITLVFFIACMLKEDTSFKRVAVTTVVAALHVILLVLSTDLGSALVFFVAYLVMVFAATHKPAYTLAGLGGGALAAVGAYFAFSHVRKRVIAWQDPFSVYDGAGFQIVQGLFAIGAGGWFGTGLCQGSPTSIPVASKDFIFAAICEEFGCIFGICLLLVCMCLFLLIVNMAVMIRRPFYKLIALGLGTEYAFQVFLTVGGVIKLIPMTGITLPLVSYGGSSVMSTIIMLAIIQGLYILREDEGVEFEAISDDDLLDNTEDLIGLDVRDILEEKGGQTEDDQKAFRQAEKKKRKRSRVYLVISYGFVALFLVLIGYVAYFNGVLKDDVLKSSYNKRQDSLGEYVIRGNIESADGVILAETLVDDEGNEHRSYPCGRLFAHVVGYVNNGKSGLESEENYTLLTAHNNVVDHVINDFLDKKNPGDTVVTTLNATMQQTAYEALGGYQGAIIALDPKTGDVICLVSKPDFDPNTLAAEWADLVADSSASNLVNRVTQGRYAPGSVFKIVTALAYYKENGSLDGYHYTCTGEYVHEDNAIHCFQGEVHGELDLYKAFAESCNCAFTDIGMTLGDKKLKATADSVLFNGKLPSDLPYNQSSCFKDGTTDVFNLMQVSFGQGTTLVTPYHMALLTAAIANDGVLMKPNLVSYVKNHEGHVVSQKGAETYGRILTEDEAEAMTTLMKGVVTEGTASALSGRGYEAAGKTGTADFVAADDTPGANSWFVGILNPDDPELVVAILAENGGSSAATAVPIAAQLFDTYMTVK